MRLPDLFRLAFENLRRNRNRSLLTIGGVLISVAALLALVAYGAGLKENARREFNALELYNTLRVTSDPSFFGAAGAILAGEPRGARADDSTRRVPLTDSLVQTIARLDGVLAAYPEIVFPVKLRSRGKEIPAQAEAIPQAFATIPAYQPTRGAFFTASADSSILLTPTMARRLGYEDPLQIVGEQIVVETISLHLAGLQRLGPAIALGLTTLPLIHHKNPVRVTGLLPEEDQVVSGIVRVLLPLDYARSLQKITFFSAIDLMMRDGSGQGYLAVRVQVRDNDAHASVRQAVEARGLYVTSFRDQFQQVERLFLMMDLALGIIGVIALLVATLGIANTMMMNVLERRREIGVMKAVGGEEGDVQRLFLAESGLVGLLGGVLGLAAGYALTALIQLGVSYYFHRLGLPGIDVFHMPWAMVMTVLGIALAVSLLAGFAPARRAARVEPMAALRSA